MTAFTLTFIPLPLIFESLPKTYLEAIQVLELKVAIELEYHTRVTHGIWELVFCPINTRVIFGQWVISLLGSDDDKLSKF